MEINKIKGKLALLAAVFDRPFTKERLAGYLAGLADISSEDLCGAIETAIRECRSFPSVAVLRDMCGQSMKQRREQRATRAFSVLCTTLESMASPDHNVVFQDPLINATIRAMGGWKSLWNLPISKFAQYAQRDFERLFLQFCSNPPSEDEMQPFWNHPDETRFRAIRCDYLPPGRVKIRKRPLKRRIVDQADQKRQLPLKTVADLGVQLQQDYNVDERKKMIATQLEEILDSS